MHSVILMSPRGIIADDCVLWTSAKRPAQQCRRDALSRRYLALYTFAQLASRIVAECEHIQHFRGYTGRRRQFRQLEKPFVYDENIQRGHEAIKL